MKKFVALALAGLVMLSVVWFFPQTAEARDSAECYRNYRTCRSEAFDMDASWTKVAVVLTICDIALGRCILLA